MRDLKSYDLPDVSKAIDATIGSERDRLVLRLRLLKKMTYQEISDYPGVHVGVRQVGNILNEGCARVGDYLDGNKKPKLRDFLRKLFRIS